jgi:thioredoxin 1
MSNTTQTSSVQHFADATFQSEVLESNRPVLVDFYADWCGPCRLLAPTIEEVAREVGPDATVGKLNVDENPQAAQDYRINSIPTVLLFKDGEVVERFVGVQPGHRYVQALRQTAE